MNKQMQQHKIVDINKVAHELIDVDTKDLMKEFHMPLDVQTISVEDAQFGGEMMKWM